jgi:hypothetical protein
MSNTNPPRATGLNPFNLYDFFGYIFPGALFLTVIIYEEWQVIFKSVFVDKTMWAFLRAAKKSIAYGGILLTVLLIMVYTVGHIIAMLSHIILDRFFVSGIMKYPITQALTGTLKKNRTANSIVFLLMELYLLFIVIVGVFSFINTNALLSHFYNSYIINLGYYGLISITYKQAFSLITTIGIKLIAFLIIVRMLILFYSNLRKHFVNFNQFIQYNKFVAWLLLYFVEPVRSFIYYNIQLKVLDGFIEIYDRIAQTNSKPSDFVIEGFKKTFMDKYGSKRKELESSDPYWIAFFEMAYKSPVTVSPLINWLHLYSFARNMSLAIFLLTIYHVHEVIDSDIVEQHDAIMMTIYAFATLVLQLRYWSLYKTYYSKNIIRMYVMMSRNGTAEDKNEPVK